MASAFDGVTVLDLTRGMAGAVASTLLGDNGARVLRAGDPGEEEYRVWRRGCESIALSLDDEGALHSLIAESDVLLESFAPSSREQTLVDYDRLSAVNSRLVHCSITAYGMKGPLRDEPPVDELVMARLGDPLGPAGLSLWPGAYNPSASQRRGRHLGGYGNGRRALPAREDRRPASRWRPP